MPETEVVFNQDSDGRSPVFEWLDEMRRDVPKAFAKCFDRIRRLETFGHEMRRPHSDFLRDGVYELRADHGNVNYRILYGFHGRNFAILAHGITKEGKVPEIEIDRAVDRLRQFESNPEAHTFELR